MSKISQEQKQVHRVSGMSCANCASKFEKNLKNLPGLKDAKVNFGASKITLYGEATVEEIEEAGSFENIKVSSTGLDSNKKGPSVLSKLLSNRTFTASVVLLALAYLVNIILGENNLLSIVLFISSILIGGNTILKTGLKNLIHLDFDIRTLMTIAVIGGAAIGEFGEVAMVVILFTLSEVLEDFSMDKARNSIRTLMSIAPKEARIRRGNQLSQIEVQDILVGDTMIVRPGEKIAMDGIVIKGYSTANQSAVTGESVPVEKSAGNEVFAGTLNVDGVLEVEVTKLVEDTTISKIIHLVEKAQEEKAPAQKFVDIFAKIYTPAIIVIALLVAGIPPMMFDQNWSDWLYQGLAVLVVGCPCALVISTPISIVSAVGNAAKQGVLIKGGIYLEEIGQTKVIAFDKTGTLTYGIPVVTEFEVIKDGVEPTDLYTKISALEYSSQHPLASAVLKKADEQERNYSTINVEDFLSHTGKGISGRIDKETYLIGNRKLLEDKGINIPEKLRRRQQTLQGEGKTVMLIGIEQEAVGLVAVADEVRQNSQCVIKELHEAGIEETIMLTGDNTNTARSIGEKVNVTKVKAELLPEDKLNEIEQLKTKYGQVTMVGDGINDTPSLAAASVGIAMGGAGTDTALETADVALMNDDLSKLPFTLRLSKKTLNTIKANITFSIIVKLVALLLVVPGWLTLWIAILSDLGATLIVTLNSMRLTKVK